MRFRPHPLVLLLAAGLALNGCAMTAPSKSSAALSGKRVSTASTASHDALIKAVHNMVAASRASTVASAASQASGVISNNSSSLISDNGLGLISNAGGSLIANNGSSLIGDKAGAFRVLATEALVSELDELVTETYLHDNRNGEFKAFDKTIYKSTSDPAEQAKGLIDHFKWDDMTFKLVSLPPEMKVDVTYTMKKVMAKRLSFLDIIKARETHQLILPTSPAETPRVKRIGWELAFEMATPLLEGKTDKAQFKGVAGVDDLVTLASGQALPKRLSITGSNGSGTYTGLMDGADYPVITFEHTDTATGSKTHLTVNLRKGGTVTRTIDIPDLNQRIVLDTELSGKGAGKLFDTAGKAPVEVGAIACDPSGLGTITLKQASGGASTIKLQMY